MKQKFMDKNKILLIGPFETNGRYKGGVYSVSHLMFDVLSEKYNVEVVNTCVHHRKHASKGKLNLENIKNFFLVKKEIKNKVKQNFGVVYLHSSRMLGLLKDLLLLNNAKSIKNRIIQIHNCDIYSVLSKSKILQKLIVRKLNKIPSKIVVLSNKIRNDLIKFGVKKDIFVLYNATYYHFDKNPNSGYKNIKPMFLGSIEQQKGIFELLEAFSKHELEDISLDIYGVPKSDEDSCKMKKYLNDRIVFHGFVDGKKKDDAFKNHNLLILPSYSEGAPISIIEALSNGVVVLATNVGAINEMVGEVIPYYLKVNDVRSIVEAVIKMNHLNESEMKLIGEKSFDCSKKFDCTNYLNNIEKIIEAD